MIIKDKAEENTDTQSKSTERTPFSTGLQMLNTSEKKIIENKRNGIIYVADFPEGKGKYITVTDQTEFSGEDLSIKLSPKIQLRITYITNKDKIRGVKISKLFKGNLEEITLTTLSFERILQLLYMFSNLDLNSITNRTLMFDKSIVGNPEELEKFLNLIAKDEIGQQKIMELIMNFDFLQCGDIQKIAQKKNAVKLFEQILNSEGAFNEYKNAIGVKKDEEVWQRFFKENSWILGSEYVEILDHRNIDEDNITDYLAKSFDGFIDIIELKLPSASFWTFEINPSSDLTKATIQCAKYLVELERKINDAEYLKKLGGNTLLKPKITLIYGRSSKWSEPGREMYRILNSLYHNLSIITYDHVFERARRMVLTEGK